MGRKAQVSIEYLGVFAVALIVMVAALALFVVEPQVAYSTKKQQSDQYWASARPFSVVNSIVSKDQALLQIQNSEPLSLTIKNITLQGMGVNFSRVSAPFNESAVPMCVGGSCSMQMTSGELDSVVTDNISASQLIEQLCFSGSTFQEGRYYEANLAITYQDSSGNGAEETSEVPLIGQCTGMPVNSTVCTLNGAACSASGDCCSRQCSSGACVGIGTGGICNSGSQCYSLHCSFEGQCVCLAPGTSCGNYTECCSGICLSGSCKPPLTLACPYPYAAINTSYSSSAIATGGSGSGYSYSITNSNLGTINLNASGATVSGTPRVPGTATFTAKVTDSAGDSNATNCTITSSYYRIAIACPYPYAAVGSSYSSKANTTGGSGSCSYSVVGSSLPPGLSMSPSGSVSGVPATAGTYPYFILANDSSGASNTQNCSMVVYPAIILYCPAPTSTDMPGPYSGTVGASGGSGPVYSFSISAPSPAGSLTLSVAGSTVSGAPSAPGSPYYNLTATDGKGNAKSKNCSITIYPAITITCPFPNASTGVPYSDTANASGGSNSYSVAVTGGLPADGISAPTGGPSWVAIQGTPNSYGNVSPRINVTDTITSLSFTQNCSISVCASNITGYNSCTNDSDCCSGLACGGGTCGPPPPPPSPPQIIPQCPGNSVVMGSGCTCGTDATVYTTGFCCSCSCDNMWASSSSSCGTVCKTCAS